MRAPERARALLTEEEARRIAETAVDRGAGTLTPSRPEIRARRYSKCRQVTSKHLLQRVFHANFHCICVTHLAHTHMCVPCTHIRVLAFELLYLFVFICVCDTNAVKIYAKNWSRCFEVTWRHLL